MWYRPGGIKDRVTGNVFVKNLPANYKSKELYDLFAPYGKIFSCKVKYDSRGECKGYGYVQFEAKESAEKALADINGKDIKGSKVEVCPFKAREARSSSITMYNNLFVKCIPKKYTNEDLHTLFAKFGEIVSAVVIKERPDSPENKGFGFVCYKKNEDAKLAEEKLNNLQLEGQALYVCRALPLEEHRKKMREERLKVYKDCNIYVKNLPDEADDEALKKAFEVFGHVNSARVMVEKRQESGSDKIQLKSKNFGFVCFSNKEEAKKAVTAVMEQQQPVLGRALYAAIAERKEDRIAKFSQSMYPVPMGMYGMPPPMYHPPGPRHRRPPYEGRGRPRPYMPEQMYPYMMPMMHPMMGRGPMPQMPPMGQMPMGQPMPLYQTPVPPSVPMEAVRPEQGLPQDKEQLGEYLYPLVESKDQKNAAKITGMLLEMEIEQIHGIIRNPTQLDKWISEALKVLNSSAPGS